ncbi:hypothetical protein LTR62_002155 [Meristemomyces frigidus]|uniref:Uncharacterized protein n=1 Tax=Meristemomyces frigidus TaxID=1508187 RepID=A0AAN7T7P0_9PEZI|nr:hypothetical protein LTR62_002155 [Meristemomyces frigidus]
MHFTLATAAAILLTLASAAPNGAYSKTTSSLATFDDLTTLPGAPELTPVPNGYDGLTWNSLDVLQAGVAGIATGLTPQSGNQVAANGVTDQLTKGGVYIAADTVKSFDLSYLYFGCVVNTVESVASVPVACTVAFTAFQVGNSEAVATVNMQFNPTNAVVSKMTKADFSGQWFSDFSNLERVEIAVVESASTATLTGLLIDNVAYKTYSS